METLIKKINPDIVLFISKKKRFKKPLRKNKINKQQKLLVEEKNKEITDSIIYAKRIQEAILPSNYEWNQALPESFICYLPKDIVAGDFYWMEKNEKYVYIAVADCTGHGVPGAMVSVTCSHALNKALLEEKNETTSAILNRTREIVIERLNKNQKDFKIQDGMDIGLLRIDKHNPKNIQYSGAHRSLYIINGENITEYKGDKQPIGYYEEAKPFTFREIKINYGDTLYLMTDGCADQFGGVKGKKLGMKNVLQKLIEINHLKMEKQKEEIEKFLMEWKGINFQVDDITMIGLKL